MSITPRAQLLVGQWEHYSAASRRTVLVAPSPFLPGGSFFTLSTTVFPELLDMSNFYLKLKAVPGVAAQGFSKLEYLVTYYSQGHQGLPCELKQPAVLEQDKDVTDDDTGKICLL